MVENLSRTSTKLIVETSEFLSEMISESMDSPPTSPPDKKTSNTAKTRDCLKLTQTNNKVTKKAKSKTQPIGSRLKEETNKSSEHKKARSSHRKKADNDKLVNRSEDKSKVFTKEIEEEKTKTSGRKKRKTKIKEKKRYEEIIIDNLTINAFRTWEDLQDELNEQISAKKIAGHKPTLVSDFNGQGSTSQTDFESQKVSPVDQRIPQVSLEHANGQASSSGSSDASNACDVRITQDANKLEAAPLHNPRKDDLKKKHSDRNEKQKAHCERSTRRDADDNERISRDFDQRPTSDWAPKRNSNTKGHNVDMTLNDIPQDSSFTRPTQQISGPNSHRLNSSIQLDRREFDNEFNASRHQPFGQAPTNFPHVHPMENSFDQNTSSTIRPQMNASNSLLHQYFNPNLYGQHPREGQNPYGLPMSNQPHFPAQSAILTSCSLASPYTSPYTITDTIISRQTIIPPSMGLNQICGERYNYPPPLPPNAFEHNPGLPPKQTPSYVPSPTERSFMEFARSFASANNLSSIMNPPHSSNFSGGNGPFNPAFDRFGLDQRSAAAFAASSAYGRLHYDDPANRFGAPNYHNDARSAINAAASFYPQQYFR